MICVRSVDLKPPKTLWVLLHLTSNQYVMQCMDDVDEIVPALWYSGGGMMPHFCSLEPFTQSPILSPPLLHKTYFCFHFVRTHFVLPISSKVFLLLIPWKLRLMVTPLTTVSQVTLLVRKFRELNGQSIVYALLWLSCKICISCIMGKSCALGKTNDHAGCCNFALWEQKCKNYSTTNNER